MGNVYLHKNSKKQNAHRKQVQFNPDSYLNSVCTESNSERVEHIYQERNVSTITNIGITPPTDTLGKCAVYCVNYQGFF